MKKVKYKKVAASDKKKIRISWYLQWVFGLIFVVAGVDFISERLFITGILCLLFGISVCPALWDILREKGARVHPLVRILVPAALFAAAAVSTPLQNVREATIQKAVEEEGYVPSGEGTGQTE